MLKDCNMTEINIDLYFFMALVVYIFLFFCLLLVSSENKSPKVTDICFTLWNVFYSEINIMHPVCLLDKGGCNGEECGLYFWDEDITPEYDIPALEDGVGTTHSSRKITGTFERTGLKTNIQLHHLSLFVGLL